MPISVRADSSWVMYSAERARMMAEPGSVSACWMQCVMFAKRKFVTTPFLAEKE